jgi:hypothetical protein
VVHDEQAYQVEGAREEGHHEDEVKGNKGRVPSGCHGGCQGTAPVLKGCTLLECVAAVGGREADSARVATASGLLGPRDQSLDAGNPFDCLASTRIMQWISLRGSKAQWQQGFH